jgi:hypothetical protein
MTAPWEARVDLGLRVRDLRGGGSCPAQYWGRTDADEEVYIRYRGGGLSIEVGGVERAAIEVGPAHHGDISVAQAAALLGLVLNDPEDVHDWEGSRADLGPTARFLDIAVTVGRTGLAEMVDAFFAHDPGGVLVVEGEMAGEGGARRRLPPRHVGRDEAGPDAADLPILGFLSAAHLRAGSAGHAFDAPPPDLAGLWIVVEGLRRPFPGRSVSSSTGDRAALPEGCPVRLPDHPVRNAWIRVSYHDPAHAGLVTDLRARLGACFPPARLERRDEAGIVDAMWDTRADRATLAHCAAGPEHAIEAAADGLRFERMGDGPVNLVHGKAGEPVCWRWYRVIPCS